MCLYICTYTYSTYQAIQTDCNYPELDVLGFLNHPHIRGEHEVVVATSGHLELNLRGQN